MEEDLQRLVEDFLTQKQILLVQVKKGILSKEQFLREVLKHIEQNYHLPVEKQADLLKEFEQYVFGYSRLSPLMDDGSISDIRVVSHDCIRIKREGKRMDAGIAFASEKEYRQFIDYIATRNQVNISNLNAIQRFTDTESHPDFIFRFTLSMPIVNTYSEPYLCIRKVPKNFPMMAQLVEKNMMDRATAELLVQRFRQGSTLICGGNSSGKTTLLNALKETLPDDMAILVAQQADELTTLFHPDMMFLHSLPGASESSVNYDLKHISIAGLTMDVDFFIIGEVKGGEALYLLNAAWGYGGAEVPAPQATLMKMIVEGIMGGNLPWNLVFVGVFLAIALEILRVPVMPFAIGLYLPIYLNASIMIGGVVRMFMDRRKNVDEETKTKQTTDGTLYCAGMIAGEGLVGILLAIFAVFGINVSIGESVNFGNIGGVVLMVIMILCLLKFSLWKKSKEK